MKHLIFLITLFMFTLNVHGKQTIESDPRNLLCGELHNNLIYSVSFSDTLDETDTPIVSLYFPNNPFPVTRPCVQGVNEQEAFRTCYLGYTKEQSFIVRFFPKAGNEGVASVFSISEGQETELANDINCEFVIPE